jgi:hypothetical protein
MHESDAQVRDESSHQHGRDLDGDAGDPPHD